MVLPERNTPPPAEEGSWPPAFALHPDGQPRRKDSLAQLPRRPVAKPRPAAPVYADSCWTCRGSCGFNKEMSRRQVNIATTLDAFVAMVQEGRIGDEDFAAAAKLWDAREIAAAIGAESP